MVGMQHKLVGLEGVAGIIIYAGSLGLVMSGESKQQLSEHDALVLSLYKWLRVSYIGSGGSTVHPLNLTGDN
jgi:hypothetical protein